MGNDSDAQFQSKISRIPRFQMVRSSAGLTSKGSNGLVTYHVKQNGYFSNENVRNINYIVNSRHREAPNFLWIRGQLKGHRPKTRPDSQKQSPSKKRSVTLSVTERRVDTSCELSAGCNGSNNCGTSLHGTKCRDCVSKSKDGAPRTPDLPYDADSGPDVSLGASAGGLSNGTSQHSGRFPTHRKCDTAGQTSQLKSVAPDMGVEVCQTSSCEGEGEEQTEGWGDTPRFDAQSNGNENGRRENRDSGRDGQVSPLRANSPARSGQNPSAQRRKRLSRQTHKEELDGSDCSADQSYLAETHTGNTSHNADGQNNALHLDRNCDFSCTLRENGHLVPGDDKNADGGEPLSELEPTHQPQECSQFDSEDKTSHGQISGNHEPFDLRTEPNDHGFDHQDDLKDDDIEHCCDGQLSVDSNDLGVECCDFEDEVFLEDEFLCRTKKSDEYGVRHWREETPHNGFSHHATDWDFELEMEMLAFKLRDVVQLKPTSFPIYSPQVIPHPAKSAASLIQCLSPSPWPTLSGGITQNLLSLDLNIEVQRTLREICCAHSAFL